MRLSRFVQKIVLREQQVLRRFGFSPYSQGPGGQKEQQADGKQGSAQSESIRSSL